MARWGLSVCSHFTFARAHPAGTLRESCMRENRTCTLSPVSGTDGRSPEVSSTAVCTQQPDLQPVALTDRGFAVICPFARHRMPLIRFLYSQRRPCASLLLHLHQVVEETYTPELSNMLGAQRKAAGFPTASFERSIFRIYPGPQRDDGVVNVFWKEY
jgi:hypothetical protein